ncbi:MAG: hydrolase [Enterovirga sp.]|jgi:nudix-type nucleoside diphosphatase (YffH/AdpP family)|nr:hydrolase [Enterovirga sp.]
MPYEILRLEPLHEGWSFFAIAVVRTPGGEEIRREVEDHGAAVAVLPYDPKRRVALLAEQFRTPVFHEAARDALLECPAGLLDGDDPAEDARREAFEEIGVVLSEVESIGTVWSMPGISTERIHLFLAPYSPSDRTGQGGGLAAEHEHITIREIPLAELAAMADDGRLDDMKTFALLQTLRLRRPALFA